MAVSATCRCSSPCSRAARAASRSTGSGTVYAACGPMPYSTVPSSDAPVARSTAARSCSSNGGRPGRGSSGVAMIARAPVVPTAAAIRSGWKYISTLVVMPLPSISADAAVIATSTSSG